LTSVTDVLTVNLHRARRGVIETQQEPAGSNSSSSSSSTGTFHHQSNAKATLVSAASHQHVNGVAAVIKLHQHYQRQHSLTEKPHCQA
jgi:hypothetical protein